MKGFFNIVEYFLRDLKMSYFLDQVDNDGNSPLHLAASKGHLSIVECLLDYGCSLSSKNREGITALELSCRKGYFDISKSLIMHYSNLKQQSDNDFDSSSKSDDKNAQNNADNPLHIACYEGAYEVVRLLLSKGAKIDALNNEGKNCLDIAISRGHREVVKVLLEDENWNKLVLTSVDERSDLKLNVTNLGFHRQITRFKSRGKKENPQLVAMFENKMWESINIILDKAKNGDDYDFR
jgi:ankyrin repeat protein